jgi:hypothetical protein
MSKRTLRIVILLAAFGVVITSAIAAETVKVITKENAIRSSCRFFAPVVTKVQYNDKLEVLSQEGDWLRVRFNGMEGCIHKSAVEQKKVTLSGLKLGEGSSATEDEVSLAGKGFNPEVEEAYQNENPEISFEAVDRIESYSLSEEEQVAFIEKGELNLP